MFANLYSELGQFVVREVASGRFPNSEAVVLHVLRMLQHERADAIAGIEAGLQDVADGKVLPLDEAFAELRRAVVV